MRAKPWFSRPVLRHLTADEPHLHRCDSDGPYRC